MLSLVTLVPYVVSLPYSISVVELLSVVQVIVTNSCVAVTEDGGMMLKAKTVGITERNRNINTSIFFTIPLETNLDFLINKVRKIIWTELWMVAL